MSYNNTCCRFKQEEIDALVALLREALDSRGPDHIDAVHPGWSERAREVCDFQNAIEST